MSDMGRDLNKHQTDDQQIKTTAKLRAELVRKAKTVSAITGVTLCSYLDGLLSPLVDRDYDHMVRGGQGQS